MPSVGESLEENVGQHTVPRFYLNGFSATSQKQVFVRARGGITDGPKSTKSLTVEDYAFTIWAGGQREDECDAVNSRIEDWVAKRVIAPGTPMRKELWTAIWLLTSNLLARSRRTRDKLKFGAQFAAYIAEDVKPILPESLATAADDINCAADLIYPLVAARGTEVIADGLREKGCNLLVAPEDSVFVTSDDPAVVYASGQPAMLEIKLGFIERKDVEVFMALKPDIAVHWYAGANQSVRTISADEVRRRNQDLYASCYKEAYSNQKLALDALTVVGTK